MPGLLYSFGQAISGVTQGLAEAMPMIQSLATVGTSLSGAAARARAVGGIPRPETPLSTNEIIRQVRAAGFSVQRQAALKVIGQVKAQVSARAVIADLPPNRLPRASQITYSQYGYTSKYQYFVQVTGRDTDTGELSSQFVTVMSDRLITKSEAEFTAAMMVQGDEQYGMTDIVDSKVQHITKTPRPGF